jgi:hypothetical protein
MAINAASAVEIRPTNGNDNLGGGFSYAGNTYAITNLACAAGGNAANPTVSSASYSFVAGDVGDWLYIAAGTNWTPGLYKIASVAGGNGTLTAPAGVGTASVLSSGSATIDRSQRNSALVAFNGTTVAASNGAASATITPAGYTVTAADVGNWLQVTGGTNFLTGTYQIISVSTAGGTWTLDRACTSAAGSAMTGNLGGAKQTIPAALTAAGAAGGLKFWVKAEAVIHTAASVSLAVASVIPAAGAMPNRLIGYGTTRGDAALVTLQLITNTGLSALNITNTGWFVENFDIDCNALGTSTGIAYTSHCVVSNCRVRNFTAAGVTMTGTNNTLHACEIVGGGAAATAAVNATSTAGPQFIERCHIHDNVCPGVLAPANAIVIVGWSPIVNNTGASSDGVRINGTSCQVVNCTIHGSGRHNIFLASTTVLSPVLRGNLLTRSGVSAAGAGLAETSAGWPAFAFFDGNGYWSNGSLGNRSNFDSVAGVNSANPYTNTVDVVATADPYVKASLPAADLTVDGTLNTKVTSSSYTFLAGDVGATLYVPIQAGWNFGQYTVQSVAGGAAVLNASPAATGTTGGTWCFDDFRLNANNPGGLQLRAKSTPGALPGKAAQAGALDYGAYQHADPAGGGGGSVIGGIIGG